MQAAVWICLLLPLASAVGITLKGTRISRRFAGYISTADDDGCVRRRRLRVRADGSARAPAGAGT